MLEVTVKTLDSQNHTFSVPDESTVKEFKEQISPVLNIPVEKQRLIFCGKVLKDDKKLNEYDVNGKVVHVVQSLPPQGNNASGSANSTGSSSTNNSGSRGSYLAVPGFVMGSFTIPQDDLDPNQMQNIVQEVVSGMGDLGRNATVISRSSDADGPSVDFRISLGQVPVQSEAQLRMNRVQTMFLRADRVMDLLENGNNSGNNSSESSSQTDNDEELRNTAAEADIGRASTHGESNDRRRASGDTSAEAPANTNQTEESQYVESGLFEVEQLTQVALSAAIATATAAAHSAATAAVEAVRTHNEGQAPQIPMPERMGADGLESLLSDAVTSTLNSLLDSSGGPLPMEIDGAREIDLSCDGVAVTIRNEAQTGDSNSEPASAPSNNAGQGSDAPRTETSGSSTQPPRTGYAARQPSVQTLANLLDEVIRINHRLEPCLEKCRDVIRSDSVLTGSQLVDAQRLFSKTSQLLHFLSHAYHSLSDLHVNFATRPPRSPRVRIISSSPTMFQQSIPVQAQINISSSVVPPSSNTSTTTSNTTASANTQSSTTDQPRARSTGHAPRSNSVPRTGLNRVPSTSSIPSMVRGSQNPMFFMEVTPGSITIDSISATVNSNVPHDEDSDASSTDTTTTPPAPTTTCFTQTDARSDIPTTEVPTSTSSRPAGTTQSSFGTNVPPFSGPNVLPAVRHLIPIPLTSMGSLQTFDSALPCHSFWALEPYRRRHHAGTARNADAQGNPATTNLGARPTASDSTRSTTTNGATPVTTANSSTPATASGTDQANASSGTAQPSATSGSTPLGRANIPPYLQGLIPTNFSLPNNMPMDMQTQFLNLTNPDFISGILSAIDPAIQALAGGHRPRPANRTPDAPPNSVNQHVEILTPEQVRTQLQDLRQSNPSAFTSTLAEFFFENRDIEFSENDMIGRAVYDLCKKITLEDFFEVSRGNFTVLNKYKDLILDSFKKHIFNFESTDTAMIDKLIDNLLSYLEPLLISNMIKTNVNYTATMQNYFRHTINVFKNSLLASETTDILNFGNSICKMLNESVLEFQYLYRSCAKRINVSLTLLKNFSRSFILKVCTGNKAAFRNILCTIIGNFIIRVPYPADPANVRSFIVSSSDNTFRYELQLNRPATTEATASTRNRNTERENPRDYRSNLFQHTEELVRYIEGRQRARDRLRNVLENQNAASSVDDTPSIVIGSENWHNSVPQDWVPLIARDVQRQRRQAPQYPLSDAYLSGMPSKRRKIMTSGTSALLAQSQSTLSDMLQQAITTANVRPLSYSTEEAVKKDASENVPLQTAFTYHVKNAIQERLQCDLNYCSEKFPNAKKYYM